MYTESEAVEHARDVLALLQELGGWELVVEYMQHINLPPKRQCGDCQLCCTLVPIAELGKPAGQRCQHQCNTGCAIYPTRPGSCRAWNCEWALGLAETDGMQRPDQVHYVIDTVLDIVTVTLPDGKEKLLVMQVWVDPNWPNAHEDPGLRDMIDRVAQPALIRFGSKRGFVLIPPSLTSGRGWIELGEPTNELDPHSRGADRT